MRDRIDRLFKRVEQLLVPLPFLVTFEDGHTEHLDGASIIDLISTNPNGIVNVEQTPEAAGQGQLCNLINGLLDVE